jgi:hypothetical protein
MQAYDLDSYSVRDEGRLTSFLLKHSNLPGPRGNLELASRFADFVARQYSTDSAKTWELCLRYAGLTPAEAPVNDPKEFLSFCGVLGIGEIGTMDATKFPTCILHIRDHSRDSRWRLREAVAMALQKLIDHDAASILGELRTWLDAENYLEWRAVVAAIAEPRFMKHKSFARNALAIHDQIFEKIETGIDEKNADFKVLAQGLSYTLSVVVAGLPGEGFKYLARLTRSENRSVRKILKENLKKNRLVRCDPVKAKELLESLEFQSRG